MNAVLRLVVLVGVLIAAGAGLTAIPEPVASVADLAQLPLVAEPSLPVADAAPARSPEEPRDEAAPAGRLRLRSVSTAPVRPRVPWPEGQEPEPAVSAPPPSIEPRRPALRLDDVPEGALAAVLADDDVELATAVEVGSARLRGGPTLTVGVATDPGALRLLMPRLTAAEPAVWAAVDRGEVVLSPDVAAELRLRAGDVLQVRRAPDLLVAGSASNGGPPLLDAIAGPGVDVGRTTRTILVAVSAGADVPALVRRLAAATGAAVEELPAASPAVARLVGEDPPTVAAFEPFAFTSAEGGRIAIDPVWEAAHIVRATVPILGDVRCHRLLIPQLEAALQHLVEQDLAHLLDPSDYGGCYVPRHIDWTPAASLSMHAWGIAVDVNVATNGLGAVPQLDRRVVEAFTDRGFAWGGDWRRPDGMHFELERLLTADELAELR